MYQKKNLKVQAVCSMFIAAVLFGVCLSTAQATRVSTAVIEDCLINESGFNCDEKTCISADVSYGIQTQLEVVQITTIQVGGEPVEVEETTEIEIEKSIPTLYYPLRFLHTVAYYPHEEVIRTPHPISGCDCQCADPNFQGFCSTRSPFDLENLCASWRGEELIGQPATTAVPYATAHCLHMGEVYFHGYEICGPTEYYEIAANLQKGSDTLNFVLSPADPFYGINQASGFKVKAELLGNQEKYKGVPELSNYILYIPALPEAHPYVQDYQNNMLILPREELSKDGSEPDKVGISYDAFRKLGGNASVSEAGDGLHNQLFQKHSADLQKLIMNPDAETEYLVHGKRKFKESMGFQAGMAKVLQYKVPEINYSQVALTLPDVTTVKVINTESLGIIMDADVQAFTSMTDEGTLVVEIANWGDLKTDYVVTVTQANMNIIKAIPAQSRILDSYEQATLTFDIHTAYNIDTINECAVRLKSPTGRLYDEVSVKFDASKHPSKYSGDLQLTNDAATLTEPNNLTAPVITLNGPELILLECNVDTYVEQGAEAVDDVDGTVAVIIGGDTVDTTVCGIYTVKYFARDAVFNFSEITRTVKVVCPGSGIEGDINNDNMVNMDDLGRLAANWLVGT
ncbi:MAG: immunoglobulin-like domain-containing protein [Planctomycetota bacterium]